MPLWLIHTRRSSLRFPQWSASTQRKEIFYLPAEMQLSATDVCGKRTNVNEPLDMLIIIIPACLIQVCGIPFDLFEHNQTSLMLSKVTEYEQSNSNFHLYKSQCSLTEGS